ncbi:TRAP transporter large permease [Bradyrhizobium sp. Leo121]|uniref:TRAP transporter large permease n=1 Tax=Bradyrhizobium sp. Leo121 TaxID=1571195 RepID=UPI00102922C8|nr:TRAP transporter large permease [Bradyrhizobium sp. Leo121]RZN30761.1 C4-dicarboxylate ABC transporter permease [Bradyrhizobium sp. Leo121]
MIAALVGFLIAFSFILFQVPIATALSVVGFGGYVALNGLKPALSMVATITTSSTLSYSLIVLPLFVLMGNLVAAAGISGDLFQAAQMFIGRRRGGLAMATIVACGGFAAMSGSSVATSATMGRVAIPSMRAFGYADSLSGASVAVGGTLGVLLPPSIIMVVYGVSTQTHIGMLFAAGIVPGVLAMLAYVLAVQWSVWRNPAVAPLAEPVAKQDRVKLVRSLWPIALIFAVVMGGIYGGLFTAVEASGIGASSAMALTLIRRSLTPAQIYAILVETAKTSGMLFAIILGAGIFGEFVNLTGIHEDLLRIVGGSRLPPFGVIMLMVGLYILLGSVLESLSLILLTVPIFFPIVKALGYDPVWFGVLLALVIEIGLIHPPIGVNLFVLRSVVPDIAMMELVLGVIPFIVAILALIVVITAFPSLSLWLPHLLFKSAVSP